MKRDIQRRSKITKPNYTVLFADCWFCSFEQFSNINVQRKGHDEQELDSATSAHFTNWSSCIPSNDSYRKTVSLGVELASKGKTRRMVRRTVWRWGGHSPSFLVFWFSLSALELKGDGFWLTPRYIVSTFIFVWASQSLKKCRVPSVGFGFRFLSLVIVISLRTMFSNIML